MNRLQISTKARQYFKKIKDKALQNKFKEAIADIVLDPYTAGKPKKGDLAGIYCYDVYHQGTNYEIAYAIEEDEHGNFIIIILAGTRENFYKELSRYIRKNKPS